MVIVNTTTLSVVGYLGSDPSGVAYNSDTGAVCVTNSGNLTFACFTFGYYRAESLVFTETGLPIGAPWSVTFSNGWQVSTSDNITVGVIPEVYPPAQAEAFGFAVPPAEGYVANITSGSVLVDWWWVYVNITFTRETGLYEVSFVEAGLPAGTNWGVNLNQTVNRSTSSNDSFWEPNGTYPYTSEPVAGYAAAPANGTVVVNGSDVLVGVKFSTTPVYNVTLTESGLPHGTNWSGSIDSVTEHSTTANLMFTEPNGTYLFQPGLVPGWTTLFSGQTVIVNGSAVNASIAWSQAVYQVLFNQTGLPVLSLPPGGQYSVTLNGTEEGVNGGDVVVFSEPNGSYPFVVTPPSGWSVSPASGTVLVQGAGVAQTLNFSEVIPPLAVNFTYPYLWTCGEPINVTFTSNVTGGSPATATYGTWGTEARHPTKRIPLTSMPTRPSGRRSPSLSPTPPERWRFTRRRSTFTLGTVRPATSLPRTRMPR